MQEHKMCIMHAEKIGKLEGILPEMADKINKIYMVIYEDGLLTKVRDNTDAIERIEAKNDNGNERRKGSWKRMSLYKKVGLVIITATFLLMNGALAYERVVAILKAGLGVE